MGVSVLNKKETIALVSSVVSFLLVLILVVLPRQSGELQPSHQLSEPSESLDLGITYIRLTPELSTYYDLEVDSGIVVTHVIPGSIMDLASVQAGDIITNFNEVKLGESVSLLELTRACDRNDTIAFEVCNKGRCRTIGCCGWCGTQKCDCGGPAYYWTNGQK